ncbi:2OG-Fe dioxygenase family protein [Spirillospora sp. NPDC048819]|uniref:2OG-Fe dioxygenase family protein n=1 Tax=Spirillospora sp. NPDC048819 TaxID=3155268 RepID=UPI0034072B4C
MPTAVRDDLHTKGYSLVRGVDLPIDEPMRRHAGALAATWENLVTDPYLKDGARFRERRYDRFYYLPRDHRIQLRPHQAYFQSTDANEYAGGIAREIAPLTAAVLNNPLLEFLIEFNFARFPVTPDRVGLPWDVQCHQFRILGVPSEVGEPTPEGPHRDEVDFGAIHLMSRTNAEGGRSQAYRDPTRLLDEFCLIEPMDTMYWADQKVLHAVTPITPLYPGLPAIRDVLILGYKCSPGLREGD